MAEQLEKIKEINDIFKDLNISLKRVTFLRNKKMTNLIAFLTTDLYIGCVG